MGAAIAPSSNRPAEMPRRAGSIAEIRPISASSSPIIETVFPIERLIPSAIRMDPYSVLLCRDIPTAIKMQAVTNNGRAFVATRGKRDDTNAAAAVRYSKKIVISDTEIRKA